MTRTWNVTVMETLPAEWPERMQRCDGGFFHSPAALAGRGAPRFFLLEDGAGGEAIAAGTLRRCRLGGVAHWYLPTLPVASGGQAPDELLVRLAARARDDGAAELICGSFDAPRQPTAEAGGRLNEPRIELAVSTLPDGDALLARFGTTHRRQARRGARDGWQLTSLGGTEAERALQQVQDTAGERAGAQGRGFVGTASADAARHGEPALRDAWGAGTFTATAGGRLLAAVHVGWGQRRVFYVAGGSTSEGYQAGAAIWLHWRLMTLMAQHGRNHYNLGGMPAAAASAEHPLHGLYRFKHAFGATVIQCRGASWSWRPWHRRLHALAARAGLGR